MRWLERYLTEGSPRLQHFAENRVNPGGASVRLTLRLLNDLTHVSASRTFAA
jgi:hypothetical protein